jgi:hypothetical protein
MHDAKTSIIGLPESKTNPAQQGKWDPITIAKWELQARKKKGENSLVTNGAFFIMRNAKTADLGGATLDYKTVRAYPVGRTSATKNYVPVP